MAFLETRQPDELWSSVFDLELQEMAAALERLCFGKPPAEAEAYHRAADATLDLLRVMIEQRTVVRERAARLRAVWSAVEWRPADQSTLQESVRAHHLNDAVVAFGKAPAPPLTETEKKIRAIESKLSTMLENLRGCADRPESIIRKICLALGDDY